MKGRDLANWSDLSLTDLFFAYRKAKVDCFYEPSIRVAEAFVDYEQSLPDKLTALLARLKAGEAATILTDGIKQPIIFPKRLHFEQQAPERSGGGAPVAHAFFSDPERAFRRSTDQR